jgi:hypothetical protein
VVSASGRRRTATWQTSRLDRGCEAALANSYSIKKCVDSVELQTPKRYMQRCLTSLQRESRRSKTQRGNIRKFKIGFVRRRTSLRACFPQNRSKKLTRTVIWSFNFCYQGVESVCSRQANREKQAKTCVSSTMYVRLQARRKVLVPGCRDPCGRRAERQRGIAGSILGRELYDPFRYSGNKEIETPTDELKAFAKIRLLKGRKQPRKEQNRGKPRLSHV